MSGPAALPRVLNGRYRLDSTLGQGGMGLVCGGVDLATQRRVAVKIVSTVDGSELTDEIAGRFLREAKNTLRLHHENIVELWDVGREETSLYFVMELIDGESLSTRLRRTKRIAPDASVHIAVQVCRALAVAHAAGVIHRDLKPANLMLSQRGDDPDFVKVLDFGVAKSVTGEQVTKLTRTGMLVGTIDYMAPEQIMARPVDARTDVYALGIVLYRMLAGRPAFPDSAVPALINAHLNTTPVSIRQYVPLVPPSLDAAVLRALAKDPVERFDSMTSFGRALLDSILADGGIEPPDDGYIDDARTVVAPYARAARPVEPFAPEDTTIDRDSMSFEEKTTRMESALPDPSPQPRPRIEPPATATHTEVMRPAGFPEPKLCPACHTPNSPVVRSCVGCGSSLTGNEADVMRSRPRAPMPSGPPPGVGPNSVATLPVNRRPPNAGTRRSVPPPEAEPPTSIWKRLLGWTGIR